MPLSFQAQDQFNGMLRRVAADVHLVDQVLDQVQAPAPRRLQAGQLGI
jgi:hypothetical protein